MVKGTYSDDQWMENFRMTKAIFKILCDDLRLVFLTRLDPYGSHFNWITELPLMCTRWPLLRNTVLLPICLVLENQQYINASMMSAQQ